MNRRDSGARLSVYCTSAVARNLQFRFWPCSLGPFFIACGYARFLDAASVLPGGLTDHVAVIRGLSIQAKVKEKAVFMRLQGQ